MAQIPRGTRDFLPAEMEKRRYVKDQIETLLRSFGYNEIQTPTFEQLELFTTKSGEGIIDELYAFQDKGGRHLALRPELTAPVMRLYVDSLQMEPKPLKFYYFGNCFRYDRPQKGRYREFWQIGCELIGAASDIAASELIAMAYTSLKKIGLQHIELNIGDLQIIKALFSKLGVTEEQKGYIMPLIDKERFGDISTYLLEQGFTDHDVDSFIKALQTQDLSWLHDHIADDESAVAELEHLLQVTNLLKDSFTIIEFNIRMSIVRGLDYYSGIVFEIHAPVLGAEKQICGGGVYELIPLFGGRNTPTAGFAIGFDRSILALESEGYDFPTAHLDVYLIPIGTEMIKTVLTVAGNLRESGSSVDIDLLNRGVGKAMKYANSRHARFVGIIGPKEREQGSVMMRDMTDGSQTLVDLLDIVRYVQKRVP